MCYYWPLFSMKYFLQLKHTDESAYKKKKKKKSSEKWLKLKLNEKKKNSIVC